MNRKLLQPVIGLTLVISFVVGCGAPAATPTPIPPTVTPTPPAAQPTPTPQPTKPAGQAKGELTLGKITSQALAGNLVGDPAERGYAVYLPPGYADGNKRYPVVYILHWFGGDEYTFAPLWEVYQRMLLNGTAQEMILVFPNANNKFGGSVYHSSPTIGDYETYLARELVTHIDANYRTIPQRDSRGITGCSMGGDGTMHLALTFPDVYSVAVPMSGGYDWTPDPTTLDAAASLTYVPRNFDDYRQVLHNYSISVYISLAAFAAPNPDKPPFYLDMPFEVVDGKGRVVPEVMEKIVAMDEVHDVEKYLQQPVRLRHILLYYGASDLNAEPGRSFDQLLTARGVDHETVEAVGGHCDYDMTPVLQYLSDHLAGEQP